ncbi:hypothetical protein NB700_001833 [Xanthomonas sacchari]|uniref:Uncharacterized protein n=1 Tax=Xanthomonas sacchari TaxID=56458 RepID=A0ABT3DV59_9XANT|nr:hypothetical protein [Xanthomonas sacchari]MCW0399277.1 hypothetical protein [Xanthomonas sacchari]
MSDADDRRAKFRLQHRDPRILLGKTLVVLAVGAALDAGFIQMIFAMLGADVVMLVIGMRDRGKGTHRADDSNPQE